MKRLFKSHLLAALLCIASTAAGVRAQQPNAWQINDNLTTSGVIEYLTNLTTVQVLSANTNGWRYDLVTRMVSDSGSAAAHSMAFGDGTRRFYIFFDLDGSGQLTAQLLGDTTYTLTSAANATNYHSHRMTYNPVTSNATYRVDGAVIASWPGQVSVGQSNQVMWGANASAGRGVMNYHRTEFEIIGQGVIAGYHAGFAGNPAVAPSPTNQAWTRFTSGSTLAESPVSPDGAALSPFAITLAASNVQVNSAILNAQLNPDGLATSYYFEYGTTTNYGSFTVTNTVSSSVLATNVSAGISGLLSPTTHHFRAVASNSAGIFTGTNLSFTTTSFYTISPGVQLNSAVWGDYDNDGLLDVLISGTSNGFASGRITQILRNSGGGFTNVNAGLPGVHKGTAAWGDYDNDGRLDVLLTGLTNEFGGSTSEVWRNTGSGFTNINVELPGVYDSAVAWGDYNNDGLLDILIAGATNASYGGLAVQVCRNTGNGFTNINAGLPTILLGSVAWGDYDKDGQLDILLTGTADGTASGGVSQVWRNTGTGFTNINAGLPGVFFSSAAWGDYDNDGSLDVLLAGSTSGSPLSQIWRNTGNGFTNINAGLPGVYYSSVAWGDYDSDGLLDVLLTGHAGSNFLAQIWRNTGSGFTNFNAGLPGIYAGSAAWGDANNDGRLDILLEGFDNSIVQTSQVRMSFQPNTNTIPAAPSNSGVTTNYPSMLLAWNAAGDSQTPAAGLTYNLRVGTAPGGSDVVGPQANASGLRRIPAMGNAQTGTNASLVLTTGTYYWSVQAVDTAFAGSPFSTEGSFTVPALPIAFTFPATAIQPRFAALNALVNPNTLATSYYFEHGLTTNYGNFTVTNSLSAGISPVAVSETIGGLNPATTYHFRIVASNATGVAAGENQSFTTTQILTNGLFQIVSGAVEWGDYDRDGRLDLLLAGTTLVEYPANVFRNTGNGFSNLNVGMNFGYGNAIAWADYDNDGDLDALQAAHDLAGFGGPAFIELWRNTGNIFTQVNTSITPLASGSLAWGDFDNDGYKDLLVTGLTNTFSAPSSQLWRNTGSGFASLDAGLPGVWNGSGAWADFDNDGRLDLVLTGVTNSGSTGAVAQIWRNTGSGFSNINAGLPGVFFSSTAWSDFDSDGWLDLLLAGNTNGQSTGAVAQVWRNTGSGFTNVNAGLPGVFAGSVDGGDYDSDGRPDILLMGITNNATVSQLWRNTGNGFTNLNLGSPGVYGAAGYGAATFGDYDNDGRLDILLGGATTGGQGLSGVWLNTEPTTNTLPAAPSALDSSITNGQVSLRWTPATDAETLSAGLSYNLRVGTAPGGGNVVSPEAESDGFRLLPALGNAQAGTNAFLNLQPGTYYWSVQAVDASLAGGPFAVEVSFVVPPPTLSILSAGTNAIISWQPPYPGWILQENLSLAPIAWSNSASGATNPITIPRVSPAKFYRVFRP